MEKQPSSPPDRAALWARLALTKAQLAALCGVTARQVQHWTVRGYLLTAGGHRERYGGAAIDRCVLIRQGLRAGLPLRRAVAVARAQLADELERQPGLAAIAPLALRDIREQLRLAEASITAVRQVVEPLSPATSEPGPLCEDQLVAQETGAPDSAPRTATETAMAEAGTIR